MIKARYVLALLLFASCVFALFQVKFGVQNLHREMTELKRQLEHEKNSVHVLKAEWAYLNKPDRLQYLAEKFLNLSEVKIDQVARAKQDSIIIAALPSPPQIQEINSPIIKVSNITNKKKVKWRYRQRPNITVRR